MTEMIINRKRLPEVLPEFILRVIKTKEIKVLENVDGGINITPIQEFADPIDKLRGSLAGDSYFSIDEFLKRKHADKELDL